MIEADDGTVLAAHGEAIGVATNNVAEYRAFVAGLERARDLGLDGVEVVSVGAPRQADARRVQGQERGAARASIEAARLAREVGDVRYHRRAASNELADRLANEALDAAQR